MNDVTFRSSEKFWEDIWSITQGKEYGTQQHIEPTTPLFREMYYKYMYMCADIPVYRISVHENARVNITWFDLIENFAPELDEVYDSVQDLPQWVQERLAVLMVLDPTQVNEEIEGVGRRISKHVFWVFGEANGANTGEES